MTILSEIDTLAKAATALAEGSVSAVELTEACLKRCEASEPKLSAFITLMPDAALEMAHAADARRSRRETCTPLTGVPLAFKDIIDVAGMRGTGHSRLYADRIAARDATAVAGLREQGAVFLGKVATNEFAIGAHDEKSLAPNARNPWNVAHTPGGSSSGSAVAVASREVFAALGTDTGGSIRVPAAFNGIVGMMPSRDLVSRQGVMPLSESMDTVGPMARTVEDVALLLDAIVSPGKVAGRFFDGLSSLPKNARYLRLRDFDERLSGAQKAAVDQVEPLLQMIGLHRSDARFPMLEELDAIAAVIATCESWSYHRARLATQAELYGQDARLKLHLGALVSGDDYLLAKRRQATLVAEFHNLLGPGDILFLPTTIGAAPRLVERNGRSNFGHWSHVGPNGFANVLGGPVIALPCGMDNGLPLSVQLVGRQGSDALLLATARALEAAIRSAGLCRPLSDFQ
ncbi:amidase [Martelella alba]|uniref:Indoleacetamide hydrolase n=1 Tax=Martelella alba TaxID=2590451 RepID=A0A506U0Q0_9HYPH|nr:amidase [Martelella alba]TPW26771.1 amidase [Martelella alba]